MSDSGMLRNTPKLRPRVPHTLWRWPKNRDYSYSLARVMGEIPFGGGELAEIEEAASIAGAGNAERWYRGWNEVAERVEDVARSMEQKGDCMMVRDAYLRSSNYYRLAANYLYPDDPRRLELYNPFSRSVVAFERASRYFAHPVEKVQIQFERGPLPAYLFSPSKSGKSPALIMLNDFDTTKEEQYFALARSAAERGMACLCLDSPGQGEALRLRGMTYTLASETFIPAVVDFLKARPEIDGTKIAIVGWGLGSYLAVRAAAYEKRLSFCFAWSALVDIESVFNDFTRLMARETVVNTLFAMGLADMHEGREKLKGKRLEEEVVNQIRCPVFILHGRDDNFLGIEHAQTLYNMLPGRKELVIVEPEWGIGGVLHNQADNLHVAHQIIFPQAMREFGLIGKEKLAA